ncbi:MAG: hypothetical protein JWR85_4200 [Marmoricola sp.]|nr:hypothetical protein [Marmoricola sp.]
MTPEAIAKSDTESGHQRAVFAWAALHRTAYPELEWLFHIPNGGSRGDDARSRMIRGANMKADGVKSGVYDLMLPVARGAYHGLFIEMKKPGEIKSTSPDQKRFGEYLTAHNYAWRVCDSWTMAVETLETYLSWNATRFEQSNSL